MESSEIRIRHAVHEVTDDLGVGGLFRDVGKPFEHCLAEGDRDPGQPAQSGPTAPLHSGLSTAPTWRGFVRYAPETVSAQRGQAP